MGRGDTSDAQWKLIEPLLPRQKRGGKWNDHRLMFDGILWVLRTGAPWRDLPERYGPWGTVYHRFNRWKKDGTLDRILKALRIRLDKDGYIDWDLWCVDGSNRVYHEYDSHDSCRGADHASRLLANDPNGTVILKNFSKKGG